MANLISAGVSVTVTDESFFIPAAAATVPLIFIATSDEKTRPDGVTPAAGTYEHNVIRTVTSLKQSTELYGIPRFLRDSATGMPHHGDARNEYGLFALNQFLGIGNRAFVLRANVNLNDSLVDIRRQWDTKITQSAYLLQNLVASYLNDYNNSNNLAPSSTDVVLTLNTLVAGSGYKPGTYTNVLLTGGTGLGATANITVSAGGLVTVVTLVTGGNGYTVGDTLSAADADLGGLGGTGFEIDVATLAGYKSTVSKAVFLSLAASATSNIWSSFSFKNSTASFTNDCTTAPKDVFGNGYSVASTGDFIGLAGDAADWVTNTLGGVVPTEWTATEASTTLIGAGDAFKYTTDFLTQTSLGANNAARRVSIVTALAATINSNTDIRSESYEYNLILCPGFPELCDEMVNLRVDIGEEAFVIGDTPFNMSPEDTVSWSMTSARARATGIAYYYPHGLASNLDGNDVMCAASGIALRTIAYSDQVSELWMVPAGTQRGLVSGVSQVGYASGNLGSVTKFIEVALNQGQRDDIYKDGTNINPIVFFPGRGIVVWGQKTSSATTSARDRVNVERLLGYIRRQLRKNTMSFIFQPNDQLTRDNVKAAVDGFLGDILTKRGLYDFATVCDQSNNTPDRIDRSEMYVDIALKPMKAVEFLYIPIRVLTTGAEM